MLGSAEFWNVVVTKVACSCLTISFSAMASATHNSRVKWRLRWGPALYHSGPMLSADPRPACNQCMILSKLFLGLLGHAHSSTLTV